ncbi:LEA type 2 family protein [Methylotuvimicrobium buryatense]|uniref:Water stress and hypersensitive response domain-containing protein n=1 Tax=Methylotuvimicrobium buryatense TaxID=95641 RepID=A0A4P9UL61_METBY|nr:LEA type 2 family protein [Methylotuvimicrobium buryatense]QCW81964.1 hypothetical protein EQU24_06655 [Methylotuvimicrobium buryatense]
MKWSQFLAVVIVASQLNACTWMYADFKAPKVKLLAIKPSQFGLFEQRFNIRLRLENRNDSELAIRDMAYVLKLNDADFAQGVSDQEITIPEYGEYVVELPVSVNLKTLLRQLTRRDGAPIRYQLTGHLGLMRSLITLPFDYEGEVELEF